MKTAKALIFLLLTSASGALAQSTNVGNSIIEWSTTQGTNGWNYGYYNRTTDGDATYSGTEFTALPTNGGGYALGGFPPWTGINQYDGHPNLNGSGEHWIIRRYTVGTADAGGEIDLKWAMRKGNLACGDGVTGMVYHNGTQVDTATINFDDATGVNRNTIVTGAVAGDTIDLILTHGAVDDGCDSAYFSMEMNRRNVYPGYIKTEIANSVTEFGENTNGWTYGMYDITANGSPDPGEFQAFPGGYWNEGSELWDKEPLPQGPWTEITRTGGHPNGVNNGNEEWATRRYTIQAGESGTTLVEYNVSKSNTGGGSGVSAHVLVNGITLASTGVTGADGTGWTGSLLVPNLQVGDTIDLALDPHGTDVRLLGSGDNSDGADGSNFGMRIFHVVPEPPFVITPIGLTALGEFRGSIPGIGGRTYTIQYSNSMTATTWQRLVDFSPAIDTTLEFLDETSVGVPRRFYRAVTPALPLPE